MVFFFVFFVFFKANCTVFKYYSRRFSFLVLLLFGSCLFCLWVLVSLFYSDINIVNFHTDSKLHITHTHTHTHTHTSSGRYRKLKHKRSAESVIPQFGKYLFLYSKNIVKTHKRSLALLETNVSPLASRITTNGKVK